MCGNWNRISSLCVCGQLRSGGAHVSSFFSARVRPLADRIGLFSTLGMAEDHNGLNNGRLERESVGVSAAV